ncbi:MAG: bifunctional riboflavin kinase/FAD synthetase [Bacteroidota bacterium]|nr:bifunctional riboflavin kinase/FAD synthetase [Bacteroidota bacterium]
MKIYHSVNEFIPVENAVVTIGTFDGVHLGHRKLIEKVREIADSIDGETVVLTFFPHPRMVIYPNEHGLELLNTINEKKQLLEAAGVDHLIIHPFDREFSELSSAEFIREVIVNKLKTKKLVIGYDHHFGKKREGNFDDLVRLAPRYGFEVEKIEEEDVNDIAVSSTQVRNALKSGDVETAQSYLGRPYTLTGKIVHGNKIGRTIGFPTANLKISEDYKLIPAEGVYIVTVQIGKKSYFGMLNIGRRPTIEQNGRLSVEVYILDFSGDIYGEELTLHLLKWVRADQKFSGMDDLKLQIEKDRIFTLNYIQSIEPTD